LPAGARAPKLQVRATDAARPREQNREARVSRLFGPVIQQAYIVPDIQEAMRHWLARGVGPFYMEERRQTRGLHDGAPLLADISAAFAYSGDQQIELIQVFNSEPSIYRQYIDANPQGGLHHLAVWVDSIEDKLAELEAGGHRFRIRVDYRPMHAYLDSVDRPGLMIQLMERCDLMTELFAFVRKGADSWDGATDPIRLIDWSSGRPRAVE
jgi:hypothetical protein